MTTLREYCQVDASVVYHLWVIVFPIVWSALEKTQQVALAKPIIALLSKEYHLKQAAHRPNVIQVRFGTTATGGRGSARVRVRSIRPPSRASDGLCVPC